MKNQYQIKNIWITFSTSIKSLMKLNQNFLCSLFHIFMGKTNYDQLKNIQKNWKELGQPDYCFWS